MSVLVFPSWHGLRSPEPEEEVNAGEEDQGIVCESLLTFAFFGEISPHPVEPAAKAAEPDGGVVDEVAGFDSSSRDDHLHPVTLADHLEGGESELLGIGVCCSCGV